MHFMLMIHFDDEQLQPAVLNGSIKSFQNQRQFYCRFYWLLILNPAVSWERTVRGNNMNYGMCQCAILCCLRIHWKCIERLLSWLCLRRSPQCRVLKSFYLKVYFSNITENVSGSRHSGKKPKCSKDHPCLKKISQRKNNLESMLFLTLVTASIHIEWY